LVEHCQANGVLIIADMVFQELPWDAPPVPEVLCLSNTSTFLCKIFSPSKDRPFACGYRSGYIIADPQFRTWLCSEKLLSGNSLPTIEQVWLSIDLLFRIAKKEGRGLTRELCELFRDTYIFGFGKGPVDPSSLFDTLIHSGLYDQYVLRVEESHR